MSESFKKSDDVVAARPPDPDDRHSILRGFASRKLNLGCGFDIREGYINVDRQAFHNPDLVGDILDLTMLPSVSFDEIVAQDVLEHFHWRDIPRALYEWNRLLRPAGTIFIRTMYLNGLLRKFESEGFASIPQQKLLMVNLFSMQKYEGDYHLCSFTERLIRFYLWVGGFEIDRITVREDWLFEIWATKVVDCAYQSLIDGIPDDIAFIKACYTNILERDADEGGLQSYAAQLAGGGITRGGLVRQLLVSDEKQDRMTATAPSFTLLFHEAHATAAAR